MEMQFEIWESINEYNRYEVSNFGKIRNSKKILSPQLDKSTGYFKVRIANNLGVLCSKSLHRLVATAFIHNPENKPCVNHKDGNKLNNRADNLEWCTYSDNAFHAYKNGLKHINIKYGEKAPNAKLKEAQVKEILQSDLSSKKLSVIYKVHDSTIRYIRAGKSWN